MSSLQLNYGYVNASEPNIYRAVFDIEYTVVDDPFETPPPAYTARQASYVFVHVFRDWLGNYVTTRSLALGSLKNEYSDTLNNYDRLLSQCIALGNTESVCRAQLDSYLADRKAKIERTEAVLSRVREDINRLEEFIKSITPPPYQPPPTPPPQPVYAGETKPEEVLPPEVLEALRQPPPPTTEEVVRQFLQKMGILREEKPPEEAPPEEKPPEERPAPTPAPAKPSPLGLLALLALLLSESK